MAQLARIPAPSGWVSGTVVFNGIRYQVNIKDGYYDLEPFPEEIKQAAADQLGKGETDGSTVKAKGTGTKAKSAGADQGGDVPPAG